MSDRSGVPFHVRSWGNDRPLGFTLMEVLLVMAVIMIVAMIAVPQYFDAVASARVAKAIGDVAAIGRDVQLFWVDHARHPDSLAEVGWDGYEDPYGNPYEYLNIADQTTADLDVSLGRMRVDQFMVPINSDFDLYSIGADEMTAAEIVLEVSQDDIIRGNNGGFIGLAEDF